jgi:hypothetical protein
MLHQGADMLIADGASVGWPESAAVLGEPGVPTSTSNRVRAQETLGGPTWKMAAHLCELPRRAGTGLIYTTGSSRVSYGLSRSGYVPTPFEWTNKNGVPWVGLIAAYTGCVHFLPFLSWQSLVGLITSASG